MYIDLQVQVPNWNMKRPRRTESLGGKSNLPWLVPVACPGNFLRAVFLYLLRRPRDVSLRSFKDSIKPRFDYGLNWTRVVYGFILRVCRPSNDLFGTPTRNDTFNLLCNDLYVVFRTKGSFRAKVILGDEKWGRRSYMLSISPKRLG